MREQGKREASLAWQKSKPRKALNISEKWHATNGEFIQETHIYIPQVNDALWHRACYEANTAIFCTACLFCNFCMPQRNMTIKHMANSSCLTVSHKSSIHKLSQDISTPLIMHACHAWFCSHFAPAIYLRKSQGTGCPTGSLNGTMGPNWDHCPWECKRYRDGIAGVQVWYIP